MKLFGAKKGEETLEEPSVLETQAEAAANGHLAAHRSLPPPTPPPIVETRPAYGIDSAIQLMRALPVDQNVELVVQVIKTTLESLKVKVSDIIEDAQRKEREIVERVNLLTQAITDFEREIALRRDEIGRLEADRAETSSVKARLELAEKAQSVPATALPPSVVAPAATVPAATPAA